MPWKSKAERKRVQELEALGKVSSGTVAARDARTDLTKLPDRVEKKKAHPWGESFQPKAIKKVKVIK